MYEIKKYRNILRKEVDGKENFKQEAGLQKSDDYWTASCNRKYGLCTNEFY